MSVRTRTTILISTIFIILIMLSSLTIFRESSEILNHEAEIRMVDQLDRANENVTLLLKNIVLETENLSRDQKVEGYLKDQMNLQTTNEYLYNLRASKNETRPVYMDLFIVDTNGFIVSAAMEMAIGVDSNKRSYYIDAKNTGATATSDIINSQADNTQIVITLSPVYDDHTIIGYAGIAIHATYFSQFLEAFEIHNSDYIILDSFDNIISHSDKDMITKEFNYFETDKDHFYDFNKIKIGTQDYLVLQRHLDFKEWTIISYLKVDEIYSKSRELAKGFLSIGWIFVIIALILGLYTTSYVTKPIVEITDTLNSIIEEEKQYKKTLINKMPLHRLESKPQVQEATEISEFRKAIIGFKNILDQGANQFEFQNNQLKDYIHTMDQELKNVNNRNLDFIQTLSHDIRTPLTLIKGYASGLVSGEVQDETMKKRFEAGIVDSANNLEYLIYDVLDFAYEIHDDHVFNKKTYSKETLINKISFKMKQLYLDNDREIRIQVKDPINREDKLTIDLMQINRVIINLINNSLKYSNPNDKVALIIEERENTLKITVYDEGKGIDQEDMNNIYEMFYRGNNKGDTKGYGLGLYISQQILKGHGTSLECKSLINDFTQMSFTLTCDETT